MADELVGRAPRERWVVTFGSVHVPSSRYKGKRPPGPCYGRVKLPANYRIVKTDEGAAMLDARDGEYLPLQGEFVEVHDDEQEARVACNRYNSVCDVLES